MNSLIIKDKNSPITESSTLSHIHETLKLQMGDLVKCTVLSEGIFEARIVELSSNLCRVELIGELKAKLPWFDLIVGVSRPQTTKKILEHATTFGAGKIHFFKAALSEKSYLNSKIFEDQSIEDCLVAGLSQSATYFNLPEIKIDKYNPAKNYQDAKNKFILDLNADKSFLDLDIDFKSSITLAIGPERGFISEDISRFHDAGFTSVKISSSILRVEHAIYSAISQLELLRNQY